MIVNTGVAITLLTKQWAEAYGLTVKEKAAENISGTNGMAVKIVDTTSITLLLMPTLELAVVNIAICLDNFYQGLLGSDLLCGHNKALGTATITLPKLD